jgi:phage terminase small subunit
MKIKSMAKGKIAPEELPVTESQKVFCKEWIFDYNGTRAYQKAYPASSVDSARSSACDLLAKPNIKAFCKELQDDLEKVAGISRLMIITEHQKLAFSSIAHLHDTWIERKEFDKLTDDQKASISSIETQIKRIVNDFESFDIEFVKIKLYDKQKSLDSLSKLMGYEAPKKIEKTSTIKSYQIVPASGKTATGK